MADLSFEAYAAWCKSRFPDIDPGEGPTSTANTVLADLSDACPVTLRSTRNGVLVTPSPQRSR